MWQVIIKNNRGEETRAPVPFTGDRLTIGRGRDCAIVLDSRAVSRLHASLSLSDGQLLFKDEGSANGCEVDGQRVNAPVAVDETTRIDIAEFRIELRRSAPSEKSRAAAPQDIAGFRFNEMPRAAKAEAAPPPPANLSDSMANLLAQQMRSVQTQREQYERNQRSEREHFEQEWRAAVTAARELRGRVGKHPKVLYFVIARDDSEVAVKVAESSRRGHCNLTLSRRHPEKDVEMEGRCWFAESDMEPESFREPRDALAELVRVLAVMLA